MSSKCGRQIAPDTAESQTGGPGPRTA
jgi:hypothetical protein